MQKIHRKKTAIVGGVVVAAIALVMSAVALASGSSGGTSQSGPISSVPTDESAAIGLIATPPTTADKLPQAALTNLTNSPAILAAHGNLSLAHAVPTGFTSAPVIVVPGSGAVCMAVPDPRAEGIYSVSCNSLTDIDAGLATTTMVNPADAKDQYVFALVKNGITSLTAATESGNVTAPVRQNVAAFHAQAPKTVSIGGSTAALP